MSQLLFFKTRPSPHLFRICRRLVYVVTCKIPKDCCYWLIADINQEKCLDQCASFDYYCAYLLTLSNKQAKVSKSLRYEFQEELRTF